MPPTPRHPPPGLAWRLSPYYFHFFCGHTSVPATEGGFGLYEFGQLILSQTELSWLGSLSWGFLFRTLSLSLLYIVWDIARLAFVPRT